MEAVWTRIFLKYSGYLSQMTLNVRDTLSQRNQHSFVYQGLFMFRSLLNGAKRDIKNNGVINFTVLDSYVLALSSFGCTEEVYINIPDFKNYLEERKKWDKENKGIDYYLGALKNEKSTELNIIEITVRLEEYFQTNLLDGLKVVSAAVVEIIQGTVIFGVLHVLLTIYLASVVNGISALAVAFQVVVAVTVFHGIGIFYNHHYQIL